VVVEEGPPAAVLGHPKEDRTKAFLSRVRQEAHAEAEAAEALATLGQQPTTDKDL
jgi:polar amino acid transport system ATP-binding protein